MFTIKLICHGEKPNTKDTLSISCQSYKVTECLHGSGRSEVTIYKGLTGEVVSRYSINDDLTRSYHECFVENDAGKTIARYMALTTPNPLGHLVSEKQSEQD